MSSIQIIVMQYRGTLTKMKTEWATPIQYYLVFENDFVHVNQWLGKKLRLEHLGYLCLSCGQDVPIYRQGYCRTCFYKIPQTGDWVMRPELSTAHLNKEDRNLVYEKRIQLQPHVVYLANSGQVKVGVTRKQQIPTRWIDQGAHTALEIAETPNRYLAGLAEVALKQQVSDKTNWRKMLTNQSEEADLSALRDSLQNYLPKEVQPYFLPHNKPITLNFPVTAYPQKVKSLSLDKTPVYEGVLIGIKGQYLLFEDETVFNIRGNEGYVVELG